MWKESCDTLVVIIWYFLQWTEMLIVAATSIPLLSAAILISVSMIRKYAVLYF